MREFRVVKRWHGDVLANKGEPSSRFYIIHRQAPTTPPPLPLWQSRSIATYRYEQAPHVSVLACSVCRHSRSLCIRVRAPCASSTALFS